MGLRPQTPRIYRFGAKMGLDWGSVWHSLPTNLGPGVGPALRDRIPAEPYPPSRPLGSLLELRSGGQSQLENLVPFAL